jgi:hypothetical protein
MIRPTPLLALFGPLTTLALVGCGVVQDADSTMPSFDVELAAPPVGGGALPEGDRHAISTDVDGDGSPLGTDCDDNDASAYPGASELDDLVDNDCDGWVDEDFVAVGDIVFTEVNRQARFSGSAIVNDGAWVEVYNTSDRTIDLANWTFVRGYGAPFQSIALDPADAPVLAPGEYAVFCDTDNYEGSAGVAHPLSCDYVWGDETQPATYAGTYHNNLFFLRRDTDEVGLYINGSRTTGTKVDSVRWHYDATNGYWPRVARFSMSLDPNYYDATDNDDRDVWCSTTETSTGAVSYATAWRWYDNAGSSADEIGSPGAENYGCAVLPDLDGDGYTGTDDCDDHDTAINPGAVEACDGVDQDCDGLIDEDTSGATWYPDLDGDGYGDDTAAVSSCASPAAYYIASGGDCDDTDAAVNPVAVEDCDGVDDDCDGTADDGVSTGSNVFFADADGDGFGDEANTTLACTAPSGYTETGGDCDDAFDTINPDGIESDDLSDEDCDGWVDEDFVSVGDVIVTEVNRQSRFGGTVTVNAGSWFEVHNTSSRTIDLSNWVIARGVSAGFREFAIDPADDVTIAPGDYVVICASDTYEGSAGATWPLTCDYVWGDPGESASYQGTYRNNAFALQRDSDRIGLYIEGGRTTGTAIDTVTWYYDAVNGYWPRDARFSMSLDPTTLTGTENDTRANWCSTASTGGTPSNSTSWSWYDVAATANDEHGTPGAANYPCIADPDADGDGYVASLDCNDANAAVYPGATETCNGVDDDCDGTIDDGAGGTTWYADSDGDSYGNAAVTTVACSQPTGYVANSSDCDDSSSAVSPADAEICNDGIDNDCDPDPTVCEWSGSDTVKADYDFRAYGTAASYSVGHAVANAGDFNGDGYDDVVVGQAYHDNGATLDVGRVLVWYGPVDTTDSLTTADQSIVGGTVANDQFGWQASFAGDVDGDNIDDLLVGAWKAESNDRGRAYLFLGGTTHTTTSSAYATFGPADANAFAGQAVSGGDYDGDGLADVLVGAYGLTSNTGAVGIWNATDISGAEDLSADATVLVSGGAAGDNLGYTAVFARDLDGDGTDDMVLGAPATASTTTPGAAYVFYDVGALGASVAAADADAVISGAANGDRFGLAIAGVGDTDGDGDNDLLITADKEDSAATDAGIAYLFTSAPSGSVSASSTASSAIRGIAASDFFGRTAAGLGDVNNDGFADVAIGATGYDEGSWSGAGAISLWYGPLPSGTASASGYDLRLTGANSSDAVGYAVAGGGDVNADGYDDFMTSAPSWDGFGYLNSGGSWLYYGAGE